MVDFEKIIGFDWDEGNIDKNDIKHGVTSKEAEAVFKSEPFVVPGNTISSEKRFLALGHTDTGRLLSVIFTIRDKKIRVISARPQSQKERKFYNGKFK